MYSGVGVVRAVVRRVGQEPQARQLAVAHLVGDLARLHVAHRVIGGGLQLAQARQRPGRELRVAADREHPHEQRVAPEQRHEPGDAGRRDLLAAALLIVEAERVQVAHRLVPRPVQLPVGRDEVHRRQRPAHDAGAALGDRVAAQGRGLRRAGVHQRQPLEAGVPGAPGRQRDHEREAAVGVLRRGPGVLHAQPERGPERPVAVAREQLPGPRRPAGLHRAARDQGVQLDVEQVREVRPDAHGHQHGHRALVVVGQVDVLVDAARDRPVHAQRERVRGDLAGAVGERRVREVVAGGERTHGRGAEQDRRLAGQRQVPAAHEAGVAREEPLLRVVGDAPVGAADDEPVVARDRDGVRADGDRQRQAHRGSPSRAADSARCLSMRVVTRGLLRLLQSVGRSGPAIHDDRTRSASCPSSTWQARTGGRPVRPSASVSTDAALAITGRSRGCESTSRTTPAP